MQILQCGQYKLGLNRPLIMGIVNLTPDSFSGDGLVGDVDAAIRSARQQFDAGADILDIGAESSRPGAIPTLEKDELNRLLPVLAELTSWGVPISIDTYKPKVMAAALSAGAAMINDITGMINPEAVSIVAGSDCGICIMHMQGEPGTMQQAPRYTDVVNEVEQFLSAAVTRCRRAGIADDRMVMDPGFGFGKTLEHNFALFKQCTVAVPRGFPLMLGLSRKSMLGQITGRPVEDRVTASVAAALLAAQKGAKILRVHDVAQTKDALAVWAALKNGDDL
jgi:dihydropteroate synthase